MHYLTIPIQKNLSKTVMEKASFTKLDMSQFLIYQQLFYFWSGMVIRIVVDTWVMILAL